MGVLLIDQYERVREISDIARARARARIPYRWRRSCALNLANARGYSVKEVIAAAEKVGGHTISSETIARRPGDPPVLEMPADMRSWAGRVPSDGNISAAGANYAHKPAVNQGLLGCTK